jgi:hypothetical protein
MAQRMPNTVGAIRMRGFALSEARCVCGDLDVDACGAVAAAVLGGATRQRFTPVVIEWVEELRQAFISISSNACANAASLLVVR